MALGIIKPHDENGPIVCPSCGKSYAVLDWWEEEEEKKDQVIRSQVISCSSCKVILKVYYNTISRHYETVKYSPISWRTIQRS